MPKETQRDKLAAQLEAAGFSRGKSRSLLHHVYTHPDLSSKFYLGKNGSFRYGRNRAESIPMDRVKAVLLNKSKVIVVRNGKMGTAAA